MKPSVSRTFLAVCALTALPVSAAAQDQPWLKDRRYTEGPGIRVGNFELHPGALAEFGYDSNFLRVSSDQGNPSSVGMIRLRLTPSFSFSTIGRQRKDGVQSPPPDVEFRGGVALTYNEFIPVTGSAAEKGLYGKLRNFSLGADLNLTIMPQRPWSGVINASVARNITPAEQGFNPGGPGFSSAGTFNRIVPQAGAELVWTPGAGLFEWRLGYQFTGTFFESSEFSGLNNISNTIVTRGRWRFFPKTALLFDGRFGFINYLSPDTATNGTTKAASHPVRAMIGMNGLITPFFGITAMGGWGASFYTQAGDVNTQDFDSFIGQVELKFFISPQTSPEPGNASVSVSSIAVGFVRDYYDSFLGKTYYERDKAYANGAFFFGGRFLLVADVNVGPVIYPAGIAGATRQDGWTDIRVEGGLLGEFRFKDMFGVNASVRYIQNISPTSIQAPGGGPDQLSYRQVETFLGFRWFM